MGRVSGERGDAHLAAYKLQPSIHDLYRFAALLFLEDRTDEFVDV